MWEFIEQYFIRPIYTGEGYNVFNTIAYVILFIVGIYGTRWLMKKWKIKINKELFYTLLPYFVFAGLLRALQDYFPIKHWLFITPGIYIFMIAVAGAVLIGSGKDLKQTRNIGWYLSAIVAGLVVAAAYGTAFSIQWLFAIAGTVVLLTVVVWKLFPKILKTKENRLVALAQILDGSASAIPITFLGYTEQHVVSAWFMQQGNPFFFLFVKIALVLVALHVIDKEKSDWNWLLKIAIVLLGLAPGLRDLARVFIGV